MLKAVAPQAVTAIVVDAVVLNEAKKLVTEDATTPSTDGSESTRPPQTCGATRPEVECAPVDAVVNGEVQAVKVISDGDAVSPLLIVPDDHTSGEDIESSPSPPPPVELSEVKKAAVVKQAEFYFSDENLPSDKFMKQKIKAGGAQGWVHLQVIANFNKMKKISKDVRAIASALESSEALVLEKKGGKYRVRRKAPFKFPDKDGMSDISSRTVLAVNIPADSSVDSLTSFFSAVGTVETVRIFRKSDPKNKDVQPPVGASRDFYATCQYAGAQEAIKAVNELTDRNSWRGGLRVTLANGMSVEKAAAKLKAGGRDKKNRQDREDRSRSPAPGGSISPRPDGQLKRQTGVHPPSPAGSRTGREGQARSRSLTELELENTARGGGGGEGASDGDGGSGAVAELTAPSTRKPRSESNVDALFSGGDGDDSPPRHSSGERLPLKGVVQSVSAEGWSWIKKDGSGSRKGGNRVPFLAGDVVIKDGEAAQPLQKGDHVEYRAWRDKEGMLMAVRVERTKERSRTNGLAASAGAGAKWQTDRATQAHFRMATGPEEGTSGFAAGRGRPIATPGAPGTGEGGEPLRRPRGSSMGGPDSKVFVPASTAATIATAVAVPTPDPSQFDDADQGVGCVA